MTAYEKIKKVRLDLGLKQAEFADILGIHQRDVSKLENGDKKFIPNAYLEFLVDKGYDVNTLFDDETPLQKIDSDENSLGELPIDYKLDIDKTLFNQVMRYVGVSSKSEFVDVFKKLDENEGIGKRVEKLELLMAKYVLKFGEMAEEMEEMEKRMDKFEKKVPAKHR